MCSGNAPVGQIFDLKVHHAFIYEQVGELKKMGVEFDFFYINNKGLKGYLKSIPALRKKLSSEKYDLVHGHYGLSALVALFQRRLPLVATFHGCDVNRKDLNLLSSLVAVFSRANIFVNSEMRNKIFLKTPNKSYVIPCGTDLGLFFPIEKNEARKILELDSSKTYILFSSSKHTSVKNWSLARKAVEQFPNAELLEISEKNREEVNLLMNACDLFLMTSYREGSPLTIKEALATNCPIVSTDVGDVRSLIGSIDGCYICSFEVKNVVEKIQLALNFAQKTVRTNGRAKITELGIDSKSIANKVLAVYERVREVSIL